VNALEKRKMSCYCFRIKFIKLDRLRWAEYMMRMEKTGLAKEVLCTETRRKVKRKNRQNKFMCCDEL
jgi:hypothetical protein